MLATNLACPPCNVGVLSTPNYDTLAAQAVHGIAGGRTVFAGQRLEGFYVDLGSIFDLGNLRPFENLHIGSLARRRGRERDERLQRSLDRAQGAQAGPDPPRRQPHRPDVAGSVIGVWASASRQAAVVHDGYWGNEHQAGEWMQVSRLGNPLFNEVLVGMGFKDLWNALPPSADKRFLAGVQHPELATLLPVLYPGVFPNLAKYTAPRADLVAILLTGIPSGIVPGFQNFTGKTLADMLRLNLAIPPSSNPNALGILGGDLAGFPNGRRVFDDVVSVELRAIAGATIPLVDKSSRRTPRPRSSPTGWTRRANAYLSQFPYLGTPQGGYQTAPLGSAVSHGDRSHAAQHHHRSRDARAGCGLRERRARHRRRLRGACAVSERALPRPGDRDQPRRRRRARRVHTGVHERRAQARCVLTAIFGSLPAGEYVVWEDEITPGPVVTVPEGRWRR